MMMRKILVSCCLILVFFGTKPLVSVGELLHLHFEFIFAHQDIFGRTLTGFNLYCDGVLVHSVNDATARSSDFFIESNGESILPFYLTAVFAEGFESPRSPIYYFEVLPSEPIKAPSDFRIEIFVSSNNVLEQCKNDFWESADEVEYGNFKYIEKELFYSTFDNRMQKLVFSHKVKIQFLV